MRIDKLRNKERIRQSALEMLRLGSADSMPMDEIAKAADVTRATLYNHFPSREELLESLALPALEFAHNDVRRRLARGVVGFEDVSRNLLELYIHHRSALDLSSCETLRSNERVVAAQRSYLADFLRMMEAAVPQGYPLGVEGSARLLARTYVAILEQLCAREALDRRPSGDNSRLLESFTRSLEGMLLIAAGPLLRSHSPAAAGGQAGLASPTSKLAGQTGQPGQ